MRTITCINHIHANAASKSNKTPIQPRDGALCVKNAPQIPAAIAAAIANGKMVKEFTRSNTPKI